MNLKYLASLISLLLFALIVVSVLVFRAYETDTYFTNNQSFLVE